MSLRSAQVAICYNTATLDFMYRVLLIMDKPALQQIWHTLLSWWQSLSGTEQKLLGFLVAVMTLFVALISGYSSGSGNPSDTVKQTANGGTHIEQQIITIGITLEEHEQRLKRRETEIRAELEQAHTANRRVLETELR
ncbi:MAG: hypothetical protein H6940_13280, partial [Burkholderiales bacterium]|nr:hypothetical protein [Burkholderiales bacterium]